MAKITAIDAGRAFMARILEKIPAEARADVQKHLENDGVLNEIGGGVLRREDHSRAMAAVQSDRDRLNKWYEEHLPMLEAGQKALRDGTTRRRDPDPDLDDDLDDPNDPPRRRAAAPAIDPNQFINRQEAAAALQQRDEQNLIFSVMLNRVTMQHFREFNEVLDPQALIDHATEKGLRLDLAHDDLVRDRREKRQTEEREAAIKQAREAGLAEGRQQAAGHELPFPVGNPEITTMDGLRTGDDKPQTGLAAALRTFHEETTKAAAAGR